MLSRALSIATVTLLIGCLPASPALAQATNLEAGKSPSQIFAGTCNACHKSPRGLLKTVPAGSLPGFLRQHYTTSSDMASLLSAFLVSNGAADTRYVGTKPTEQPKDAKPAVPVQLDRFGHPIRPAAAPTQEAARPDADGLGAQAEPGRPGRNAKRPAQPGEDPDAAKPDGQAPAQAALTDGPAGRKSAAKQKLSKRGKPGIEEPPKSDAARDEPAKGEAAKEEAKGDTGKDTAKDVATKPSGEGPAQSAKVDVPKETGSETPALRPDPVPPVTPAPPPAPSVSAAVSNGTNGASEPAPAQPAAPSAPPAVTAAAPSLRPVPPAGPPAPPISQ